MGSGVHRSRQPWGAEPVYAYVGSRTARERNGRGDGLSVYKVDPARGTLERGQVVGGLVNPSFLALNKKATSSTRCMATSTT